MKDHPNTVANRLAYLDQIADQIAEALVPHGFTYYPRIEGAENENDTIASIEHEATQATLVIGFAGALLYYFTTPTPDATERTEYQSIRLGYSTRGLPVMTVDLKPIVFLARLVAAELARLDAQLRGQAVA